MRDFSSIVRVLSCVVGHRRQNFTVRCRIAPQLVRHQPPRYGALPLQEPTKEPFSRAGVAISLNEYVDHVPILVDSPPEIVTPTLDGHEDFIQVPHVAEPTLATLEISCVFRSKLPAPLPDRLVGDDNPPLRQEFLDIAEAQGKPMVKPNTVADDFVREPVTAVAIRIRFHPRSLGEAGLS